MRLVILNSKNSFYYLIRKFFLCYSKHRSYLLNEWYSRPVEILWIYLTLVLTLLQCQSTRQLLSYPQILLTLLQASKLLTN